MGSIVLKLKILIAHIIYFPLILKYKKSKNKEFIDQDIERWGYEVHVPVKGAKALAYFLWFHPQFRNLFFFRIQCHSGLLRLICKPDPTISIADDCEQIVGGSVYFEHAIATRIAVNHIGYGCRFRQLTTFGVKSKDRHEERPYIGDNVGFGANVTCWEYPYWE